MGNELARLLAEQYGGEEPTYSTADVLGQMPPRPWGGLKSYLPEQPDWMKAAQRGVGNAVFGSMDRMSKALPPGVGDILRAGILGPRAPVRIPSPIKAYHGSPHDFDQFSLARIGTGEGAQTYGHGLYFAEEPRVAQSYRDALSWKGVDWTDPAYVARFWTQHYAGDASKAIDHLARAADYQAPGAHRQAVYDAIDLLRKGDTGKASPNAGRMYEVALHASPEQFLNWDAPLSSQSPAIQQAALRLMRPPDSAGLRDKAAHARAAGRAAEADFLEAQALSHENQVQRTGEEAWRSLARQEAMDFSRRNGSSAASNFGDVVASKLGEAGIPGIRYLDQGSRTAGSGTSNYVVWSPEIIEIMRKYAVPPAIAAPALAAALSQYGDDAQ